jgi:hypothetical protein
MFRSLFRGLLYGGKLFAGLLFKSPGASTGGHLTGRLGLAPRIGGEPAIARAMTGIVGGTTALSGTLAARRSIES